MGNDKTKTLLAVLYDTLVVTKHPFHVFNNMIMLKVTDYTPTEGKENIAMTI